MARNIVTAVLCSPMCSALLFAVAAGGLGRADPESVQILFIGFLLLGFLITATLGLIWHLTAERIPVGWLPVFTIASAAFGAVVGLPVGEFFEALGGGGLRGWSWAEWFALLSALVGATSAITAWLICRPDRDPPNPPKL